MGFAHDQIGEAPRGDRHCVEHGAHPRDHAPVGGPGEIGVRGDPGGTGLNCEADLVEGGPRQARVVAHHDDGGVVFGAGHGVQPGRLDVQHQVVGAAHERARSRREAFP